MKFSHRFKVQASLEQVAGFHQDSRALKRLTPPPVFVQMLMIEPLAENSVAAFNLWFGPIPVYWRAQHAQVIPQSGFTDVQIEGPFQTWSHQHIFHSLQDGRTEVVDEITAELGRGLWKGLISRLMWFTLPALFAYRGWVTRRSLER